MKTAQQETISIVKRFPFLDKKEHRFLDLAEEVGELATAMMYFEKWKKGKHKGKYVKKDIADALADILFDLFVMAELYGLDLENEYKKMIARLKARAKKGEFN